MFPSAQTMRAVLVCDGKGDTSALFTRPRPVSGSPRSSLPGCSAHTCLPPPPAVAETDRAQGDRYRDRVELGQARLRHVQALHGRDGGRALQDAGLRPGGRARDGRARRGRLIDVVGASHWNNDIASLAPDGCMVMLSFLSGRELEKVDSGPLLFKRLRILGTTLRARSVSYQPDLIERFTRNVVGKLTGPGPRDTAS
jgi:hypothetical protein